MCPAFLFEQETRRKQALHSRSSLWLESGKNLPHDSSVYISKSEVPTIIAVSKLLMINAKLVQDGGVEIMHVDLFLNGVVTVVVSFSV